MPTGTPSVETVLAAVKTAMDAISGIGTVLTSDNPLEDAVEWVENSSPAFITAGSMDLWVIDLAATQPFEGEAVAEFYDRYDVRIRYWSLRTATATWSAAARAKAQSVVDALTGAAAIFAIGSQRQLFTPEVVQIVSGPTMRPIDDAADNPQQVMEMVLGLQIEARRWS